MNDIHEFINNTFQNVQSGKPGIGFHLTEDGIYDMQHKRLVHVADPTDGNGVVNYMTMKAQTLLLDGSNRIVGHLNMSGKEIINSGGIVMNNKLVKQLGNPVDDQDAVNF